MGTDRCRLVNDSFVGLAVIALTVLIPGISDAGLGAVAYTFEFLMGYMGGTARWRTMPWMMTMFGIFVMPLGLAHIALVMSQPVVVHHWCTFCLVPASIMLPMIPLEAEK